MARQQTGGRARPRPGRGSRGRRLGLPSGAGWPACAPPVTVR